MMVFSRGFSCSGNYSICNLFLVCSIGIVGLFDKYGCRKLALVCSK